MNVEVKKVRRQNGHDCWGNLEYENYYIVEGEDGEIIYSSESDPTCLINYINK